MDKEPTYSDPYTRIAWWQEKCGEERIARVRAEEALRQIEEMAAPNGPEARIAREALAAGQHTMSRPEGLVTLEVRIHEDEDPEWAEWEMHRNLHVGTDHEEAVWIGHGTAPSFPGALDAAMDAFVEDRRGNTP